MHFVVTAGGWLEVREKEIAWKGKAFAGLGENTCNWSFALLLARHLGREGSRAENYRSA